MADIGSHASEEGIGARDPLHRIKPLLRGRIMDSGRPSICSTLKTMYPFMKGISRSSSLPLASSVSVRVMLDA
jgi:hypothetical protein